MRTLNPTGAEIKANQAAVRAINDVGMRFVATHKLPALCREMVVKYDELADNETKIRALEAKEKAKEQKEPEKK